MIWLARVIYWFHRMWNLIPWTMAVITYFREEWWPLSIIVLWSVLTFGSWPFFEWQCPLTVWEKYCRKRAATQ